MMDEFTWGALSGEESFRTDLKRTSDESAEAIKVVYQVRLWLTANIKHAGQSSPHTIHYCGQRCNVKDYNLRVLGELFAWNWLWGQNKRNCGRSFLVRRKRAHLLINDFIKINLMDRTQLAICQSKTGVIRQDRGNTNLKLKRKHLYFGVRPLLAYSV